ncbi:hypothetical protein F8388_016689 [Cannabis sativa]|uniref:Uncharacterized protein n=1 Tax=Cannabis sativa TaxID=3483 RepID=A0A7J6GY61_CANSA|nr:hypothetical protein F8388_016689 [Cannabis sativa]
MHQITRNFFRRNQRQPIPISGMASTSSNVNSTINFASEHYGKRSTDTYSTESSLSLPEQHSNDKKIESLASQSTDQFEQGCGNNGKLPDVVVKDNDTRKASFKLSWRVEGEQSEQHKHDIISLTWASHPMTVLIFTKLKSPPVDLVCEDMVRWLKDYKNLEIYVEPRVRKYLLEKSPYFEFVHTWRDGDDTEITLLHKEVDFVVTLGGDGTVLWAASKFKGPVPPVVPFSLGSLGFMTRFGSMVHPQVPGILFTPICPHSLSFRPLIMPEHVKIRVEVPRKSRSHAWASFDGKGRIELKLGDALEISMAPWPVPTACLENSTTDFFNSIHEGLHWNLRKAQNFDGPTDLN